MTVINKNIKKILLINLGGIGDTVMMTPLIKGIRESILDLEKLSLLTIPRSYEVALNIKGIDEIFVFPLKYRLPKITDIFSIIALLLKIRKEKFDAVVNLRAISTWSGCFKMWLLLKILNPSLTIGRDISNRGFFYDIAIKEDKISSENEVFLTTKLLQPLGITIIDTTIKFDVDDKSLTEITKFITTNNISAKPFIGIHPGAFRPSRRWPPEKWRELILILKQRYPQSSIILTGEKNEIPLAQTICNHLPNCHITNGKLSISLLAALLKKLDIFITNDTGTMHLAAAVGTTLIVIFGHGDHIRYAPSVPLEKYRLLRVENIPSNCNRPCYKYKCENPICLTGISPKSVADTADEFLKKTYKE